jgi:hypothetical protein
MLQFETSKHTALITIAFVALAILCGGCRPSAQEVADVVSKVPLGASRDDVRKILVEAYSKKVPKSSQHGYALVDPPLPVTIKWIETDKKVIAICKKEGSYEYFYPSDLYDKMPSKAFADSVGVVAETSDGSGYLTIYYDSNTNYIGFFANSTAKAR